MKYPKEKKSVRTRAKKNNLPGSREGGGHVVAPEAAAVSAFPASEAARRLSKVNGGTLHI